MSFINCGNISIYSLFYLFYSIFELLDHYSTSPEFNIKAKNPDDNIKLSTTFIFIMFIAEFLTGLIGIGYMALVKYSNKYEYNDMELILNRINIENQIILDNPIGQEFYKKWIKLFFVCIFDSITTFILIYDDNEDLQKFNLTNKSLLLIFVAFFSSFYLKYTLYRHHIFGLCIVILGYLFNNIFVFKFEKDDFKYIIILIPIQLINAWREIFEKDLIEIHFLSIYELLTIEGFMGFVLSFLIIIILKLFDVFDYSVWKIEIEIIILTIISFGCFNIFRLKINQIYSPIHRCVGDNFVIFMIWIVELIKNIKNGSEMSSEVFIGIGFVFCIFGTLILTEMVSFSLCNLDIYTRKEQVKRANKKLVYNDFIL